MVRRILAGGLILAGLVLVALSLLPTQYEEISLTVQDPSSESASSGALSQTVQLRLPKDLPTGEPVLIEMTLLQSKTASASTPDNRMVEGRLDLPGLAVLYPEAVLNAPYQPGQTSSFRWLVTAGNDDPLTGRLWLTIVKPNPDGNDIRQPLMVRPFDLTLRRILGMDIPVTRWVGGGLAAIGLVGFIIQWRGRKKKPKRHGKSHRVR